MIHRETFRVPASAIDHNGHVNNLVYLEWFVESARRHTGSRGWNERRFREAGGTWVARSHAIRYHRPLFEGDEVTLETWLDEIGRFKVLRRYRLLDVEKQTIAEAETVAVFVDPETLRPVRIPEEMKKDFNMEKSE
ncbi:acyl-CoA thioesterase [Hydrogenimonas sp.]